MFLEVRWFERNIYEAKIALFICAKFACKVKGNVSINICFPFRSACGFSDAALPTHVQNNTAAGIHTRCERKCFGTCVRKRQLRNRIHASNPAWQIKHKKIRTNWFAAKKIYIVFLSFRFKIPNTYRGYIDIVFETFIYFMSQMFWPVLHSHSAAVIRLSVIYVDRRSDAQSARHTARSPAHTIHSY